MLRPFFLPAIALLSSSTLALPAESPSSLLARSTSISASGSAVEVSRDGKTVLRYLLKKGGKPASASPSACYFHPITTPSGLVVTDVGPDDHPHHRGVFLAWLEVQSAAASGDFWGWGKYAPIDDRVIVHRSMSNVFGAAGTTSFTAHNEWIADSVPLLEEAVSATCTPQAEGWIYDLTYRLSPRTDLTLGQHAFSGFSVRLRKDLPLAAHDPSGPVKLPSPSHLKPESDWPDRPWYAFEMAVDSNRKAGVAVLSHPKNPTTLWHNVISIALLNPCIIAAGPVTVKKGEPLFLRYRVVTFDGPVPTAFLDRLADEYSKKVLKTEPSPTEPKDSSTPLEPSAKPTLD
jgi:hypothetical protein